MSIEELSSDFTEIRTATRNLLSPTTSLADVVAFLRMNLVPYIGKQTDEIRELGQDMQEIVEGAEELLHPETGALFLGIIASGRMLVDELKARGGSSDPKLSAAIQEWEARAGEAEGILNEIVINTEDEGDPDEEDPTSEASDPGKVPS